MADLQLHFLFAVIHRGTEIEILGLSWDCTRILGVNLVVNCCIVNIPWDSNKQVAIFKRSSEFVVFD